MKLFHGKGFVCLPTRYSEKGTAGFLSSILPAFTTQETTHDNTHDLVNPPFIRYNETENKASSLPKEEQISCSINPY